MLVSELSLTLNARVPDGYDIPAQNASFEWIEKRSRFLAVAIRVNSRDEVSEELVRLRELHPKANHVCYAFIAGAPSDTQSWGFSDDGEPSGTAGKPILSILQHSGIGCILVAVVRYFGGIKLGTGGLVRAYGTAAKEVLSRLETSKYETRVRSRLSCGFEHETRLRRILQKAGVSVDEVTYNEEVCMVLQLTQTQSAVIRGLLDEGWLSSKAMNL